MLLFQNFSFGTTAVFEKGDTLSTLVQRYCGKNTGFLWKWVSEIQENDPMLRNERYIPVGKKIPIPCFKPIEGSDPSPVPRDETSGSAPIQSLKTETPSFASVYRFGIGAEFASISGTETLSGFKTSTRGLFSVPRLWLRLERPERVIELRMGPTLPLDGLNFPWNFQGEYQENMKHFFAGLQLHSFSIATSFLDANENKVFKTRKFVFSEIFMGKDFNLFGFQSALILGVFPVLSASTDAQNHFDSKVGGTARIRIREKIFREWDAQFETQFFCIPGSARFLGYGTRFGLMYSF